MASYTPTGFQPLSSAYGLTTAGQTSVAITPNIGGDSIALVGSLVVLRFETTGTGAVITLDSVALSSYGQDQNITVTLGTTAVAWVPITVDNRFKQTAGNVGYLNLSYTSVTGLKCEAFYSP